MLRNIWVSVRSAIGGAARFWISSEKAGVIHDRANVEANG